SRRALRRAALLTPDPPSRRRSLDGPEPDVVPSVGVSCPRIAKPYDQAQGYFFFSSLPSLFSALGSLLSFLSPLGSAAAAPFAAVAGPFSATTAPFSAATSSPSCGSSLPLPMTSGSFPASVTALLVSNASSFASDIGAATLTTIWSLSSKNLTPALGVSSLT